MSRRTLSLAVKPAQGTPVDDVIERTCSNCRFWATETDGFGPDYSCRRKPPMINHVTGEGTWPKTHPEDWCGEFKRLPLERP